MTKSAFTKSERAQARKDYKKLIVKDGPTVRILTRVEKGAHNIITGRDFLQGMRKRRREALQAEINRQNLGIPFDIEKFMKRRY